MPACARHHWHCQPVPGIATHLTSMPSTTGHCHKHSNTRHSHKPSGQKRIGCRSSTTALTVVEQHLTYSTSCRATGFSESDCNASCAVCAGARQLHSLFLALPCRSIAAHLVLLARDLRMQSAGQGGLHTSDLCQVSFFVFLFLQGAFNCLQHRHAAGHGTIGLRGPCADCCLANIWSWNTTEPRLDHLC